MIAVQLRAAVIWHRAAGVGHVAARLPHVLQQGAKRCKFP